MNDWSHVPVDDVGYLSSAELFALPDGDLIALIAKMASTRYQGERNHENRWRDLMGLDAGGRTVLDYGCGTGMEALELMRAGNQVILADIFEANVRLAERVLALHGCRPLETVILPGWPVNRFHTFHASGVLHHIREPEAVMAGAWEHLYDGGDARLMLYSDQGWRNTTGTEPPDSVLGHEKFGQFVQAFDAVGDYADWYDEERLRQRFGRWFTVERCEYMTPDRKYLGAVLRKEARGAP